MNKFTLLVAIPLVIAMTTHHAVAAGNNCDALQVEIQKQIDMAKANESDNEAIGYQQALDAIKSNCDVVALIAQSKTKIDQLQEQVNKALTEVTQLETSLTEALSQNNESQIAKFEQRVIEKQQQLEELQDSLEVAQAALQVLTNK